MQIADSLPRELRSSEMPFPINISIGDGSVGAVALGSAAIVLVFLFRPIIKLAKPEDLRFYAGCVLVGVFGLLITGAVCTQMSAPEDEAKQAAPASESEPAPGVQPASLALLSARALHCRVLDDVSGRP